MRASSTACMLMKPAHNENGRELDLREKTFSREMQLAAVGFVNAEILNQWT
jgi:hypothetical protein